MLPKSIDRKKQLNKDLASGNTSQRGKRDKDHFMVDLGKSQSSVNMFRDSKAFIKSLGSTQVELVSAHAIHMPTIINKGSDKRPKAPGHRKQQSFHVIPLSDIFKENKLTTIPQKENTQKTKKTKKVKPKQQIEARNQDLDVKLRTTDNETADEVPKKPETSSDFERSMEAQV